MEPVQIRGISSMATRALLAELAAHYQDGCGFQVQIESVGGVEATRRVQSGEAFDLVLLASDAIDKLLASAHLRAPRVDWVRSPVAAAVRAGASKPPMQDEQALRRAVLDAARVAYSTGPSGAHLARLFERWGVADQMKARTLTPPPGTSVASVLASGQVDLGFQQLSELRHQPGIEVVGLLPDDCAFVTTFSAAVSTASHQPDAAWHFLEFLNAPQWAPTKHQHGMTPV